MFTNRSTYMLTVVTILVLTACAPQVAATPATQPPIEPVTLHLAVADQEGRPSDPYVREFIEQVNTLSNGSMIIQPIWDAGAYTTPSFEPGIIKALQEGRYDLGLVAARAFDTQGITSFQALQAPFLITDDALAKAVAASDISAGMLDKLSSTGMVGLTLWHEELRHPLSTAPNKPILAPEDFAGLTIRAAPSDGTYELLETFGATPMFEDDGYRGAELGLSQIFLTRTPAATGNVVFFPKFQVLFANSGTFETLTEAQRTILQNAAVATQQKAIAEIPSEAVAASAWCENGGSIVMASDEQVAAFEVAAQPVFARIEQDPFNAEMIAAIRELKAKTQPSAGVGACGPTPELWSEGPLPEGTWIVEMSVEDLVKMGVPESDTAGWAGVGTFTFQEGKAVYQFQGDTEYECEATYEVVEDFVRITYPMKQGVCSGVVEDVQWRLEDDGLHFQLLAAYNTAFREDKAVWEAKPWQMSESSASMPHPFAGETSWIAYQTNRGGEGIWLIHPDGTEDHQIAKDFQGYFQLPDWSPDGRKIVMTPRDTGGTEPLYEYDLETETLQQLFACEDPCLGDDEPAYSPDGTKVAFIRALGPFTSTGPSDCGLWIGEIATGEFTQVTSNPSCYREVTPRWSPDGSKIAYFREQYDSSGVTTAIFVIDSNGGEEQQLTDWELVAGYPDWSPDGEWILFATHPLFSFNFDAVVSNLYRMRPDGSEMEQLTFYETPEIRANQPRYTPDGKWIIFTAVSSSSRSLWAIPAEGGEPIVIAQIPGGIYTHGTWQP